MAVTDAPSASLTPAYALSADPTRPMCSRELYTRGR